MKKIFAIVLSGAWLIACNDEQTNNEPIGSPDNTTVTTPNVNTTTAYSPADGDVRYRNTKIEVRRNGEWVESNDDITLDNGTVIYRDGRVRRDNKEIELEDGEVVDRTGNFFDKTGQAIENAWDDAKEGVKDAGKAIEKGAKKAADKTEDAFDGDDDKK